MYVLIFSYFVLYHLIPFLSDQSDPVSSHLSHPLFSCTFSSAPLLSCTKLYCYFVTKPNPVSSHLSHPVLSCIVTSTCLILSCALSYCFFATNPTLSHHRTSLTDLSCSVITCPVPSQTVS